ncbi:MAG: sugar MFS transporter [Sporocytophaga sp.]|uniref:sugar MFS transporter n=1 Tax=Sporocytophaga sp. TaxID=2231183 RepID=UPI001AFEACE4|nr:sugar MFS transporter [Sporocytophaga sp.]MBO9698852.1 sugar MFS transporter [Sporocytophaga sp.]
MAISAPSGKISSANLDSNQKYGTALSSLMVLFFMMGFITCFNDILIPYLKVIFKLNYTQVNLINFCFFGAYFVMSIPGGKLVEKYGYKAMMITGFVIAAIGCILFFPAAELRIYGLFLGALFILATGVTLLQVAGNPYVAVLGPPSTSSARLTLTQALNSLGTTIAPIIGTRIILSNLPKMPKELNGLKSYSDLPENLNAMLNSILEQTKLIYLQGTYLSIAAVLLIIGGALFIMKLPAIGHGEGEVSTEGLSEKSSIWGYRHLILGIIGIFAYVGAEVAIGSHIINYLEMKDVMGISADEAGYFLPYYWGGAMVGRFIGTVILSKFNPGKVLGIYAVGAISLILISIATHGSISMWTLLLVGFCNSLMFPTIFTLAIKGVGKFTEQASGLLCTAIVGGAILPLLFGKVADITGDLKMAMIIPIVCYVYISFFGFKGHKPVEN